MNEDRRFPPTPGLARAVDGVCKAYDRAEAKRVAPNLGGRQQREAARAMLAALKQIVQFSANFGDADEQPEETEWDSMQDAYDQGCRSSAWDAAAVARDAIAAAEAAGITPKKG